MELDIDAWHDLFVAAAGAAAALAGLVFVAISINIERILKLAGVPDRAGQTVAILVGALVASLFGLIPQQPRSLALELVCLGAFLLLLCVVTARGTWRTVRTYPSRLAAVVPGTVPYIVGGAILLAGGADGIYWVGAGLIGAMIGGVINAWVLLVEILR